MRRLTLILTLLLAYATPVVSTINLHHLSTIEADSVKKKVKKPKEEPKREHPASASAICRDGTYSYSRSRRGTCSHHGGVAQWL